MDTKDIKNKLQQTGYIHLPFPNKIKLPEITSIFGEVIFKTLIKEDLKSTRLLAGNSELDLHTDHIKAKYIAWQCNSQAAIGGESLLLDSKKIFANANEDIIDALQNIYVKSHRLFFDDKPQYPLYSNNKTIYYAAFLCDEPKFQKEKQAFEWFQKQIQLSPKIEIKLSEGDWLIIDNHRMLHGRKGFEKKSNRLLTRYWLSGQANI